MSKSIFEDVEVVHLDTEDSTAEIPPTKTPTRFSPEGILKNLQTAQRQLHDPIGLPRLALQNIDKAEADLQNFFHLLRQSFCALKAKAVFMGFADHLPLDPLQNLLFPE